VLPQLLGQQSLKLGQFDTVASHPDL